VQWQWQTGIRLERADPDALDQGVAQAGLQPHAVRENGTHQTGADRPAANQEGRRDQEDPRRDQERRRRRMAGRNNLFIVIDSCY